MRSAPTDDLALPPEAWPRVRRAADRLISPVHRILQIEAASGVLLLIATVVALGWANSPWSGGYASLWHTEIGVRVGDWVMSRPLHFWINDGLMTMFFFVVGLEIRREVHEGELADLRRAALPLAAALGGMVVPAAIYAAINAGGAGAAGWGVPMATDIAFAVGVLTVLGSRVPAALRVLLLALAVIDDIGAILVIAIFYSDGVALGGLAIAAAGCAAALALRAFGVRSPWLYVAPGVVVWAGLLDAGIHPTLAGVVLGMLTPVRSWFGPAGFAEATRDHLDGVERGDDLHGRLAAIEQARREAVSPGERLIHALHPWVAFGAMPLFALANAGVPLGGASLDGDGVRVLVGIIVALAVGKPLGIILAAWIAARLGVPRQPGVALVGVVGGIGFTMSLFIAALAFPPGPILDTAKLAILIASGLAMLAGLGLGLRRRAAPTAEAPAARR